MQEAMIVFLTTNSLLSLPDDCLDPRAGNGVDGIDQECEVTPAVILTMLSMMEQVWPYKHKWVQQPLSYSASWEEQKQARAHMPSWALFRTSITIGFAVLARLRFRLNRFPQASDATSANDTRGCV